MSQDRTIERRLDTDRESPALEISEIVAEMKGRDIEELTPIWDCLDGALDNVFSDPPTPDAELIVSFNYEGYRVTVSQDGTAWFERRESAGR